MKTLRPIGTDLNYSINQPAPRQTRRQPTEYETEKYADAQRMYLNHDWNTAPLTKTQEEKRVMKKHHRTLIKNRCHCKKKRYVEVILSRP